MPKRKTFVEEMDLKRLGLFDKQMAFVLTKQCPVKCDHCYSDCGPDAPAGNNRDIYRWLKEASLINNIETFVLTGGEPFCKYSFLVDIVNMLSEKKKEITLYTNAYWADSVEVAINRLKNLTGVKVMVTSIDRFHLKYIPLENIKNLVAASQRLGFYTGLVITLEPGDNDFVDEIKQEFHGLLDDYSYIFVQDVCLIGRAHDITNHFDNYKSTQLPKGPCTLITSVIGHDGSMFACCSINKDEYKIPPLYVGNVSDSSVQNMYDKFRNDPLLLALRVLGPAYLAGIVFEAGLGEHIKDARYLENDMCSLCLDLFSSSSIYEFLSTEMRKEKWIKKIRVMEKLIYGGNKNLVERIKNGQIYL